jgi:hypothetical protein
MDYAANAYELDAATDMIKFYAYENLTQEPSG